LSDASVKPYLLVISDLFLKIVINKNTHTKRERDRQRDRETERQRDRETDGEQRRNSNTNKQTNTQTHKHKHIDRLPKNLCTIHQQSWASKFSSKRMFENKRFQKVVKRKRKSRRIEKK